MVTCYLLEGEKGRGNDDEKQEEGKEKGRRKKMMRWEELEKRKRGARQAEEMGRTGNKLKEE